MNNGAVRCGHLVCRPVSGIFSQTNLSNGYHNVATIPVGASNISITELKNSANFLGKNEDQRLSVIKSLIHPLLYSLVLKSDADKFILNGDFSITPSGIYDAAGTVFDYKRIDTPHSSSHKKIEGVTEWITAIGPTTEPLHLMVGLESTTTGFVLNIDIHFRFSSNIITIRELNTNTCCPSTLARAQARKKRVNLDHKNFILYKILLITPSLLKILTLPKQRERTWRLATIIQKLSARPQPELGSRASSHGRWWNSQPAPRPVAVEFKRRLSNVSARDPQRFPRQRSALTWTNPSSMRINSSVTRNLAQPTGRSPIGLNVTVDQTTRSPFRHGMSGASRSWLTIGWCRYMMLPV